MRAFLRQVIGTLFLPCYVAFRLATDTSAPGWLRGMILVAAVYLVVHAVTEVRAVITAYRSDTPYVTMDGAGLACSLPKRRSWAWWDVIGCASRNEKGRRVLRLFLSGRAKLKIDIDFGLAADPKRSLDEAMVACVAWIAAARDASETESPIREFDDGRQARAGATGWRRLSSCTVLFASAAVFCLVVVIVIGARPRRVHEARPMPVDGRPERRVLLLGDSRIAMYDLPKMVRDVADSAHAPIRYDIHMRAWDRATFQEHWNDAGDRAALREPWSLVVLQPRSEAFISDLAARDTTDYGSRLIWAAGAGGSQAAVMANWPLRPRFFSGDTVQAAAAAKSTAEATQRDIRALAGHAGAGVIDLDGALAEAGETLPEVAMTDGRNDPSHAGTYLAALVIYGHLSHADVANVTWRPYDMSRETAAKLKDIAGRHMR